MSRPVFGAMPIRSPSQAARQRQLGAGILTTNVTGYDGIDNARSRREDIGACVLFSLKTAIGNR